MTEAAFYASIAEGAIQGVIAVMALVVVICLLLVSMEMIGGKV